MKMAAASSYVYKTRGRGRGILGLTEYIPCRRPGCVAKEGAHTTVNDSTDTSGAAQIHLSYTLRNVWCSAHVYLCSVCEPYVEDKMPK